MTSEKVKVIETIGAYRQLFESSGVEKIDYPHDELLDTREHGLAHCHGMLDRMEGFVRENRMDKAFRWLGFVQGVVWAQRVYPLTSLMSHNYPAQVAFEPGWLQRDVERAAARIKEWEAPPAHGTLPKNAFPRLESAGLRGAAAVGKTQLTKVKE